MAQGASLFRLINIVTAVLIVLGGILLFVNNKSWNSSILGVFIVLFGLMTFALEFAIPEALVYNLGFMFSLLGRGCFYISIGLLTLAWKWFNILVGCFIMAIGVFYIVMHFVGATPSPSMSAVPNTSTTNLNAGSSEHKSYTNPTEHVDDLQPQMAQTYPSHAYQNQNTSAYDASHA
ncbi:Late Golgi vesicles protein [Podila clonocystis]|nr:Late Golgi vesicles protein [Podila clonocystis]